jgi:hypothetical protein
MEVTGICIVAPPQVSVTQAQSTWIQELRAGATKRGQDVKIFRTVERVSERRDEPGRKLPILEPWEADRLYTLIHRGHYAVFQAGRARIRLDPIGELSSAASVALARVVRYKVYFAQFDGSTATEALFQEFDDWLGTPHIETYRDCRVLPLHMFAPQQDWSGLTPVEGREEFERAHGKPTKLIDECARPWKQPNAMHGQEALMVANWDLPKGFHWDVSAAANPSRLTSLVECWSFRPGAYANVSPDGHIRGGQSSGVSARREGTAPRPPVPEPARAGGKKPQRKRRRPDGK